MSQSTDIGELFANATAAIENAHSASLDGHVAPSSEALRSTRLAISQALLELHRADQALTSVNEPYGPPQLLSREDLKLAISLSSSSPLDFSE
ncbi:MAG: hypothetical protein JJ910_12615 [Maricaulis sp.]|nr:hypothetical protein [Maricaulis sp.]